MHTTEQASFAQRLLENDEQVLEDVLREYGPVVLSVLSRRYENVLRETDIEDVMSIGLFRLWTNRHQFDGRKASVKVWFFRIVENAARDVLKHGWHKARLLEVSAETPLLGAASGDDDGGERDSEQAPTNVQLDLREIVAGLPEKQRGIVMADAATKDGVASSQWLGDQLNMAASSVRVYRKRAMDRIRLELIRRGHDVPDT